MLIHDQHPHNRSIMVGLVGLPNAGKSSLINTLLGEDLTAVTHLPQTTRNRYNVIVQIDRTEIILVDTPGLHRSQKEMNKRMNEQVAEANEGPDLHFLILDLGRDLVAQIKELSLLAKFAKKKCWLILNKSDLLNDINEEVLKRFFELAKEKYFPTLEKYFYISTKTEDNIHLLTGALCDEAQIGPHLYNNGRISNLPERFFISEYVREKAFELLKEELPYEMAVVIDDYLDCQKEKAKEEKEERLKYRTIGQSRQHGEKGRGAGRIPGSERAEKEKKAETRVQEQEEPEQRQDSRIKARISAAILVNRPSQRAIVVGSKGANIKWIGTEARKRIEELVGGRVYLNLHVKVSPKWFKNNRILEELGLPRAHNSARVWRKRPEA